MTAIYGLAVMLAFLIAVVGVPMTILVHTIPADNGRREGSK